MVRSLPCASASMRASLRAWARSSPVCWARASRRRASASSAARSARLIPPVYDTQQVESGSEDGAKMARIAVVTGTSSGIGLATSLELARNGYRVFAGLRNPAKAGPVRDAAAKEGLPVEVIPLDVTSTDAVA